MTKILFVCTGNTCRSPMAAAVLQNKKMEKVQVKSAGIFAIPGSDASPYAKQVLNENGINLEHVSTPLTEKEVEWANLILTMTKSHKQYIIEQFEEAKDKTYTFKEYADEGEKDVFDPFGGSLDTYRRTYEEITALVEKLLKKIAE